jgi:hypothetical protein
LLASDLCGALLHKSACFPFLSILIISGFLSASSTLLALVVQLLCVIPAALALSLCGQIWVSAVQLPACFPFSPLFLDYAFLSLVVPPFPDVIPPAISEQIPMLNQESWRSSKSKDCKSMTTFFAKEYLPKFIRCRLYCKRLILTLI